MFEIEAFKFLCLSLNEETILPEYIYTFQDVSRLHAFCLLFLITQGLWYSKTEMLEYWQIIGHLTLFAKREDLIVFGGR